MSATRGEQLQRKWVKFLYRGFHDVPREVIVPATGGLLLLSCPFSDALDDYPEVYELYWLDEPADLSASWERLAESATERLGSVRVEEVVFDARRRNALDLASLGAPIAALAHRFSATEPETA